MCAIGVCARLCACVCVCVCVSLGKASPSVEMKDIERNRGRAIHKYISASIVCARVCVCGCVNLPVAVQVSALRAKHEKEKKGDIMWKEMHACSSVPVCVSDCVWEEGGGG